MNRIILFLCFFTIACIGKAQNGNISIVEDDNIASLVEKHKYINQEQKHVGWRIQIFFDSGNNSKSKAYSKKGVFMSMYPDVSVYLIFQAPYYKVRVGDFRTRMDAEGFKQKLLGEFPDAFVVKDEINPPGFY